MRSKYITYDEKGNILLPNIKKIFIPDYDMEIMDADLSGADAQIYGADSECKALLDFFSNPKKYHPSGKLYAWVASEHLQREVSTDEPIYRDYKASHHGCVTGDHEVLTYEGWVRIDKYDETKPLAVWDKETSNIHFEIPKDFNRDFVLPSEPLYNIEGASFSQLTTLDHKFPRWSNGKILVNEAKDLPKTSRIPYSGYYKGGTISESLTKIRLMVALQADGCVYYTDEKGESSFQFRFTKERKIQRLENLLKEAKISFKKKTVEEEKDKFVTTFTFKGYLHGWMKHLDWWILLYTKECIEAFIDELPYWDGTTNYNGTFVFSTDKKAVEVMQTLIHLTGKASKCVICERDSSRKTLYRLSINGRKFYRCETGIMEYVQHNGTNVYCPQTSTGFFLVRRNGYITVTGNTWYGMATPKLAITVGCSLYKAQQLMDFYDYIYPEKRIWQERLVKEVEKRGYISNKFGRRFWFLDKNDPTRNNKIFSSIPQSTTGEVINRAWIKIRREIDLKQIAEQEYIAEKVTEQFCKKVKQRCDVLMQVHDSLVIQYPILLAEKVRPLINGCMRIPIPYDPPLIIPSDFKVSTKSYGDCAKVKKEEVRNFKLEETRKDEEAKDKGKLL
jgi:hypothetical protein